MRPKAFFGVALVLATLMSCSDQLPSQEESVAIDRSGIRITVPDTSQFITPSRALDVAARYNRLSPSRSAAAEVENIETILDSDGQAAAYVINYANNGGFIIVSASQGYYPILAQSDKGAFHVKDITDAHPASLWLGEQKGYIRYSQALPDSVRRQIAGEWMRYNPEVAYLPASSRSEGYPDKPQVFYDSLRRWTVDPNVQVYRYDDFLLTQEYYNLSEYEKQQIVNGIHIYGNSNYGTPESSSLILVQEQHTITSSYLLDSEWNQVGDYASSITEISGEKYLGCTTVAVGQIMRYHRHPSTHDGKTLLWDLMLPKKSSTETANFLHMLGTDFNVNFADGGATNTDVTKALSNYGYSWKKKSYNRSNVLTEIVLGYPVYMSGMSNTGTGAHAWVCDGDKEEVHRKFIRVMTLDYRPTSYSTPTLMVEAYSSDLEFYSFQYLHFNWGWGGSQNGYYSDESFKVTVKGEKVSLTKDREDIFMRPIK